ncbi:MAG: hypothetical protein GYA57_20835 [Myxococcales bacterium]|nr:hypothetical protein [Myxococcales bacterium]
MRRRQRERRSGEILVLVACLAAPACSLHAAGLGDDDASPDATDVDVPPVDGDDGDRDDAGDDGPTTDGGECETDLDCGDQTCSDGWRRCVDHHCVPMGPFECPQDTVLCTRDYCFGPDTACIESLPTVNRCSRGYSCNREFGCVSRNTTRCSTDDQCADTLPCTIDRCAPGGEFCIHDPPDADGDTVGGNYDCDLEGHNCQCPGGDCNDEDPTISPDALEDCRNGRDDDCDTLADYADPDSPCGNLSVHDTCEQALTLVIDPRVPEVADELKPDAPSRPLDSWCVPGSSFEGRAVYWNLDLTDRSGPSRVVVDTKDCGFDTVISLFRGCGAGAPELICNDDRNHDPAAGSRFEHRWLDPGLYVVRVAGRSPDESGRFTLHFRVEPAAGQADCDHAIRATDGGTFIGRLSDPGGPLEHRDAGSCAFDPTAYGDQERFQIDPVGEIDLFVDATGTPFNHVLYLRAETCSRTVPSDEDCDAGTAGDPAVLFWPAWAGRAFVTLDWDPPPFTEGNPDQLYQVLILP